MRKTILTVWAAICLTAAPWAAESGGETAQKASKRYRIAVIPKGTTHIFWKSIHAGAAKAAEELGVDIIWKGPQREDDRTGQIQVVENFITVGVDGIVLAPLDDRALVRPVEEARREGIDTVIIDSGLDSENIVSFVATDNFVGGQLGAKRLAEAMGGGGGKVVMMRYQEGSASTHNREEGFMDTLSKDYSSIEVISSNQYGGATVDTSRRKAESLMIKFADFDGLYGCNEPVTRGLLQALKADGRAGKVKFVGFDAEETLVQGLRDGHIDGLSVQNPFKMGYLGVKAMVDHLEGRPVEKRVDTGVVMVTPENLDTPEIQELLNPDLERWLKE